MELSWKKLGTGAPFVAAVIMPVLGGAVLAPLVPDFWKNLTCLEGACVSVKSLMATN
jgi:hypothetical protein